MSKKLDFSKRKKGESKREYAARMLGGSKEDYNSDGSPKKGGGSSSKSSKNNGPSQKDLDEAAKKAFTPPAKSSQQIFDEEYTSRGLGALKAQVATIDASIQASKDNLNTALGTVNENPWLTEASRVGKANRLQNLAQTDINNKIAQRDSIVTQYNSGVDEINGIVTRATNDNTLAQSINQGMLNYLLGQQTVANAQQNAADNRAVTLATSKVASGSGKTTSSTTTPKATTISHNDIFTWTNDAVAKGYSWADIAGAAKDQGIDTSTGSYLDQLLHKAFPQK